MKWLFGSGKAPLAQRGEDSVWISDAARLAGMTREVDALAEAERSVVVVALSVAALDRLAAVLLQRQPTRCADTFGKEALRASLARPGAVAIALASALPVDLAPVGEPDILVHGRNDARAADEAIERCIDLLGPNAHLTFHLSLEDPLLQQFAGQLKPILDKLGMQEDEPIAHAMVTRAIRNAQEKRSG